MKSVFLVLLMLILLASFSLAADTCDEYCQEEDYSYGECLNTTDDGFCEGDSDMTVYGFDYCTDFQRCCCGSEDTSEDEVETEEEETENESSEEETENESSFTWDFDWGIDFTSDSTICTEEKSTSELIFWFLLVIVIILGLSNLIVQKKPKEEDEEISLE